MTIVFNVKLLHHGFSSSKDEIQQSYLSIGICCLLLSNTPDIEWSTEKVLCWCHNYFLMPWFFVSCWWNQLGPFLLFTANNIGMLLSGGVWFMGRIFFVLGIQEGEKIIPRLLWSNKIIVGIFFTLVNNNLAFSQYLIPMEEVENIYSHGTKIPIVTKNTHVPSS